MAEMNPLRGIPQLEKILSDERFMPFIEKLGRPIVADAAREIIAYFRGELAEKKEFTTEDLFCQIEGKLRAIDRTRLQRLINGTGVIIHTNFGRAPIPREAIDALGKELTGYCNLEFFIPEKRRGKRGGFAESLVCTLTGAEDALVVNNNAAAVFLILSEFAKNRQVIISRGELVQIGGGFRIPDIMRESGAHLVEVGTTNITTREDYRSAITDETAMILSVHRSNFEMKGFVETPSLSELASLKSEKIIMVRDIGSGNMVLDRELPKPFEHTIAFELSQGPDLVCFSGDKLLGSSQAGIIIGRKTLIQRLRKNSLLRIIRVDKVTYYLLQNIMLYYANNRWQKLPLWKMILDSPEAVRRRALRFIRMLSPESRKFAKTISVKSTFGGGAMPAAELASFGIVLSANGLSPQDIYDRFITWRVPIAGIIAENAFMLDFRTLFDGDLQEIAYAFETILTERGN